MSYIDPIGIVSKDTNLITISTREGRDYTLRSECPILDQAIKNKKGLVISPAGFLIVKFGNDCKMYEMKCERSKMVDIDTFDKYITLDMLPHHICPKDIGIMSVDILKAVIEKKKTSIENMKYSILINSYYTIEHVNTGTGVTQKSGQLVYPGTVYVSPLGISVFGFGHTIFTKKVPNNVVGYYSICESELYSFYLEHEPIPKQLSISDILYDTENMCSSNLKIREFTNESIFVVNKNAYK